jgi:hypothetical protein
MNIGNRLAALESAMERVRGDNTGEQWAELRELFTSASTDNAALIGTLAAMAGTRRLAVLVERSAELGHRLGVFCRQNRFRCPDAKIIKVRPIPGVTERSVILRAGDASDSRFLQIFEVQNEF